MTTLKQGDLIKDRHEHTSKVMGVCGKVVHLSYVEKHDKFCFTSDEKTLKERGYTWDTPAWEPSINKKYWYLYINRHAMALSAYWANDEDDHKHRDFLGIYQTKELAEAALLEIRRKLGK